MSSEFFRTAPLQKTQCRNDHHFMRKAHKQNAPGETEAFYQIRLVSGRLFSGSLLGWSSFQKFFQEATSV